LGADAAGSTVNCTTWVASEILAPLTSLGSCRRPGWIVNSVSEEDGANMAYIAVVSFDARLEDDLQGLRWARASRSSADLAQGLGKGELDRSSSACAKSSTPCASLTLFSSCSRPRTAGRVGECARSAGLGRGRAHHVGKKRRGTISSRPISSSMPVIFPTRAAGSTAYTTDEWGACHPYAWHV